MKYPIGSENTPYLMLDGDEEQKISHAVYLISTIVEIDPDKTKYFIEKFGIDAIFKNPSLMGVTQEQEQTIKDLHLLISGNIK